MHLADECVLVRIRLPHAQALRVIQNMQPDEQLEGMALSHPCAYSSQQTDDSIV